MDKVIQAMQENVIPAENQTKQAFYAPTEARRGLRVLFVGNSITRHGPKPEAGWHNDWGMAATAREKDIAKLADILGHSSINTTRTYIVTTGAEHRQQMALLHLTL